MIPTISQKNFDRLTTATIWVENYGSQLIEPDNGGVRPSFREQPNLRGLLLQDIYGGGTGLLQPVGRTLDPLIFRVEVLGFNSIAGSKFKLRLTGFVGSDEFPLGETDPIPVASTASELQTLIDDGFTVQDTQVFIGNPYSSADLFSGQGVVEPVAPLVDPAKVSYPGVWLIAFDKPALSRFSSLILEVFQDADARMLGLSTAVSNPILDVIGGEPVPVSDIFYRPATNPWKAGSLAACINFIDLGYGIMSAEYRDINFLAPPSPPVEPS